MIRKIILPFLALAVLLPFSQPQAASVDPAGDVWFVRCGESGDPAKPQRGLCEVFQRLTHTESGARIAELAIGYPEDREAARGILSLPLGILLQDAMQIQIDDQPAFGFKVRFCDSAGCHAYLNMDESVLEKFRAGKKITVSFTSIKQQKVNIELSLKGFTAALKKVS